MAAQVQKQPSRSETREVEPPAETPAEIEAARQRHDEAETAAEAAEIVLQHIQAVLGETAIAA